MPRDLGAISAATIREYEREGLPIWAVSVQNEPEARQTWDSCLYTARGREGFRSGPPGSPRCGAGRLSGGPHRRLGDHNRDAAIRTSAGCLRRSRGIALRVGRAFHCTAETIRQCPETPRAYPDKQLVFTEGCQEKWAAPLGSCAGRAVRRVRSSTPDRWTTAWIDLEPLAG